MTLQETEELRQDCLQQQLDDYKRELRLQNDFEYALDYFNIFEDMTIVEFRKALQKMQHYYPDLTAKELLTWI